MSSHDPSIPSILTTKLILEARRALPEDWLLKEICAMSSHWRIKNLAPLEEADLALRALFLIAYKELSKPRSLPGDVPDFQQIKARRRNQSTALSIQQSTDDSYGSGFYTDVEYYSQVLIDRSPTSDPTELLRGISDFLRSGFSTQYARCGQATRVIENIWTEMNVGWVN